MQFAYYHISFLINKHHLTFFLKKWVTKIHMSSCIELLDNFWHLQFSLGQTSNDKHFSCIFKICLSFSFLFTVHFFFIDVLVIYPLDVFFFFFFFIPTKPFWRYTSQCILSKSQNTKVILWVGQVPLDLYNLRKDIFTTSSLILNALFPSDINFFCSLIIIVVTGISDGFGLTLFLEQTCFVLIP